MNRPQQSKLLYLVVVALLIGAVATLAVWFPENRGLVLIGSAVALFIPGRIQGLMFREHYRGRRLMNAGEFAAAIEHFESFLVTIRQQPWREKFIWLAWSFYSWDIEAMTLNNLGAALMNLNRFDAARDRLEEALRIDPLYPVPHFNLAVLATAQGDQAQAREELDRAASLGFSNSSMDQVIQLGQSLLARVEG